MRKNKIKNLKEEELLKRLAHSLCCELDKRFTTKDAALVMSALENAIDGLILDMPVDSRFALGKYCFFTKVEIPDRTHRHNDINNPGNSIETLIPGKTRAKITERAQYRNKFSIIPKDGDGR